MILTFETFMAACMICGEEAYEVFEYELGRAMCNRCFEEWREDQKEIYNDIFNSTRFQNLRSLNKDNPR